MKTKSEYLAYQKAVERNLSGLEFVSTGACPGCDECGLPKDAGEHELEIAGEPHFSWHACEACGSTLGGNRYPAHGRDKDGALIHFRICEDCLYFLNYGRLDDMTMAEMAD